jgi:hypothetical protein
LAHPSCDQMFGYGTCLVSFRMCLIHLDIVLLCLIVFDVSFVFYFSQRLQLIPLLRMTLNGNACVHWSRFSWNCFDFYALSKLEQEVKRIKLISPVRYSGHSPLRLRLFE